MGFHEHNSDRRSHTKPNSASSCATSFREGACDIAKICAETNQACLGIHLDSELPVVPGKLMVEPKRMSSATTGVMMEKSVRQDGTVTRLEEGGSATAPRVGGAPRSASRRVGSFARPPCGAAMVRENDGGVRATSLLKLSRSCVP
jgi:hypothetical protein